jgi:predicted nucleic acid-binding protein
MTYLFDASSLILLIRSPHDEKKLDMLRETKILDLTYYEVGNAVWKESELLKSMTGDEREKVESALVKTLSVLESVRLSSNDFVGILDLAKKERLTFYDASYLYAARSTNMVLVSEDGRLARIARKYTETQKVHSLL